MPANIQHLLEQAKKISADFKASHLAVVDLIANEVDAEQAILDDDKEEVMHLTMQLHQLATECGKKSLTTSAPTVSTATSSPSPAPNRYLIRRLVHIYKLLLTL